MAEALVYWKDHWMDELKNKELDQLFLDHPEMVEKYARRLVRGDVIEIHEDGWWDNRGFNINSFVVVKVPGLSVADAKLLVERITEEVEVDGILTKRVLKRRRYSLPSNVTVPADHVVIFSVPQWRLVQLVDKLT